MAQLLCLERPDLLALENRVAGERPGAVAVEATPFYPGGGGQLPDAGTLRWAGSKARVFAMERDADGRLWHLLEPGSPAPGEGETVEATVDAAFRGVMRELHTGLHLVNALVFQAFDGALVTGVRMAGDGTARIDFDLPDADNDRLRALEPAINDAIRRDLPVVPQLVSFAQAQAEPGTLCSKAVMPPVGEDGLVRVVETASLDRLVCSGMHLASTGVSRSIRILEVKNKGRCATAPVRHPNRRGPH